MNKSIKFIKSKVYKVEAPEMSRSDTMTFNFKDFMNF